MTAIWYEQYSKGVPHFIDEKRFESLQGLFDYSVNRYRHLPAFSNMGVTIDYQKLDDLSDVFAAYLQLDCGVKKGDRVGIMLPNVLQYPVILFAAFKVGAVVVNINPLYTASEIKFHLNDADIKVLFVLENFAATVQSVIQDDASIQVVFTGVGDLLGLKGLLVNGVIRYFKKMVPRYDLKKGVMFKKVLGRRYDLSYEKVGLTCDDLAFLQYTGGTTGIAKGAMLSHGNMIANLMQANSWFKSVFNEGEERIITALPLYHIFSLLANGLLFVYLGGCNILVTNPRDIKGFIHTLSSERFTAMTGVNTLFNALVNHSLINKVDFGHLKMTLGGGMAVQQQVAQCWFDLTGCMLLEAYGLTEASPAVCINPVHLKQFNGAIGLPIPSTQICLKNDTFDTIPFDQVGELCVKGPQVMRGYWNNEEETKLVFTDDGWLRTGDMASVTKDGFVQIVGRKKDMILVSGFNVYPHEIEDVIVCLEGVLEAAAVGVADDSGLEIVKLFVVKSQSDLTDTQIVDYCRQHLARYKVPKLVEFVDSLPKTMVGKILHRKLRSTDD